MSDDPVFDKFVEACLAGKDAPYPNGAAFVDASKSFAGEGLLRYFREGRPCVVFYPDGEERIVIPQGAQQPTA